MKAYLQNGKLMFEIPADHLIQGAQVDGGMIVSNPDRFLDYCAKNFTEYQWANDEEPAINRFLDELVERAAEDGAGVDLVDFEDV